MHFGTAKAVSRAAIEDLLAVDGISESIARLIYNHFHEKRLTGPCGANLGVVHGGSGRLTARPHAF